MARYLITLFLIFALSECQLHRVNDWVHWTDRCGMRSKSSKDIVSWTAQVLNKDNQISYSAVIISQRHVVTVKAAVTQTVGNTETVIDSDYIKVAPLIPIYGEAQTIYDVQRSIIPVRLKHEFDKPILLNLAILEVSVDFHANTTWACPVYSRPFPLPEFAYSDRNPEMMVLTDGRNSGSVVMDRYKYVCKERYCERFLMKLPSNREAHIGDIWYVKVGAKRRFGYLEDNRRNEYDYVVGIELVEMNNPMSANFHYLLNGKLHLDTCSEEQRREMIRLSTPFRRISHTELRSLKRECGSSKSNLLEEHIVPTSFLVTIMANQSEFNNIQMCSGVLISHSHVVSSAECLKKILRNATTVAVFFADHQISEDEKFPFMKDDIVIPNYDTSPIGKKWSLVNRITTLYTGDANKAQTKHDIALLQLELPIPQDSYIKYLIIYLIKQLKFIFRPICLPPNSLKVPERLKVAWNKNPSTGLIKRVMQTAEVDTLADSCTVPEDCEIQLALHYFMRFHAQTYLVGYLSLDKNDKEIVVRTAYFTSFICLHTGVCEDGESLKSRLFLLYESHNMDIPPNIVVNELNEWKYSRELDWDQMEKEMASVVNKLSEHKYRLNRLSPEEYEEVKHACGKIAPQNRISDGTEFDINKHPWATTIAHDWYGLVDLTVCGGSLISKRHPEPNVHRPVRIAGSWQGGHLKTVKTIAFTDRHEPHVKWFYDLAILELFEDIQLSPQTQMLCISDYSDYHESVLSPIARVYGGGRGMCEILESTVEGGECVRSSSLRGHGRIQYLEYNLTRGVDPSFIRRIDPDSSAVEEFGWRNREGRAEIIQVALYYLVLAKLEMRKYNSSFKNIRMSGVCPNGDIDPVNMREITVNGIRLC
uniref:Peptidase S1 domain-containing protein n=1 Tax=Pristionchus pacificus TaxID=54126 RepID=A0A8R1UDN6_PRIPA